MTERLNLGQFIDVLAAIDPEAFVFFDFGNFTPERFTTWRGAYEQLALTFTEARAVKVADVLAAANDCVGAVFEGYKGGNYRMDRNSKLWVANYGHTNWTGIAGVTQHGHHAVINTAWMEDDL